MTALINPLLLILLTLVAVVLINILLIASVQSHARNSSTKPLKKLLTSIQEPFRSDDGELAELANLVAKLNPLPKKVHSSLDQQSSEDSKFSDSKKVK